MVKLRGLAPSLLVNSPVEFVRVNWKTCRVVKVWAFKATSDAKPRPAINAEPVNKFLMQFFIFCVPVYQAKFLLQAFAFLSAEKFLSSSNTPHKQLFFICLRVGQCLSGRRGKVRG